jgi:hypothetical protein
MLRLSLFFLALSAGFATDACGQSPYYQPPPKSQKLGVLGGLTGAGIGAAIGEDRGNAVPGALIGGAIGALSGAVVGDSIDQQQARRQAIVYAQQQQMARAVTLADVVTMTHAGLADEVIITQIQTKGMFQPLTTNDLIMLKQQGVRDRVITAMQQVSHPAAVVPAPPVIVDDYHYCRPYPVRHHWHYHHPYHHHPRATFHFRFGH